MPFPLVPKLCLAFETRQRLAPLVDGKPAAGDFPAKEPIEVSALAVEADAAAGGNGRQGQPGPRSAAPAGE